MAFRWRKTLALAAISALLLTACGSAPAEAAPKAETPPAGNLVYIGSAADPLSYLLFDALEEWAREENWAYVSYDCQGVDTTQAEQVADLVRRETPGVAILYPIGSADLQDEGVETLYRAGFAVITLSRESGDYAKRYVSCHIGLSEEEILPAAARMVNETLGRRNAGYIRLSNYWPDPQADDLAQALFPAYHQKGEGYTSGQRVYGQMAVEDFMAQESAEDGVPDFIFSMSQAAALGAADAIEGSAEWAEVPIFALQGDFTAAREVAYGRLAGTVCVSPRELTERLLDAIPQVAEGKRLFHQDLTPVAVTQANAKDFLREYED